MAAVGSKHTQALARRGDGVACCMPAGLFFLGEGGLLITGPSLVACQAARPAFLFCAEAGAALPTHPQGQGG